MRSLLSLLSLSMLWASTAAAQFHQVGAYYGTSPQQVFTGQAFDATVTYENLDGFGDNHMFTRAEVTIFSKAGTVSTGNLLTNGATVILYSNGLPQGFITVTGGAVLLQPGWAASVSASYTARMGDIGTLISRGDAEGLDLHDAFSLPSPEPTGGQFGSAINVVQGIALQVRPIANFGQKYVQVQFTRPKGVALKLQSRGASTPWQDVHTYPATANNLNVMGTYPLTADVRFWRLIQP